MSEHYDFHEVIDSLGQMTYWDTATGERIYPAMELLTIQQGMMSQQTPQERWPEVYRVTRSMRWSTPVLQWPTEDVRAQLGYLTQHWIEQLVEHHGILLTHRQRDLVEMVERKGHLWS